MVLGFCYNVILPGKFSVRNQIHMSQAQPESSFSSAHKKRSRMHTTRVARAKIWNVWPTMTTVSEKTAIPLLASWNNANRQLNRFAL